MSVIVELSLPSNKFQLGDILSVEGDTTVNLETMVPLGGRSVPFFRVQGEERAMFEANVRGHVTVSGVFVVNSHNDETLYGLEWESDNDAFFSTVKQLEGHVLDGTGGSDKWHFQLRFPTHGALSDFQQECFDSDIPIHVKRIYNPTKPDSGPWYGLTSTQRETLSTAVECGYYSLPRRVSTKELADQFDVSDQAVTERLRRAVETLVTNTLLLTAEDDDSD